MKKKHGFTLIELLAVIVILAVIAIIAVPMVLGTIEKAKKGAFEQTLNGVVRAVDLYKAKIQMTEEFSECRYFSFGSDVTEVTVRDGKKYYPLKDLSIKGSLPTEGEVKVCKDEILMDASDGTYSGRYEDESLNISKGDLASSDLTTPIIDIFNTTSTTNSIVVVVSAHSQSVGGVITNYYYKIDDEDYIKTTEQSYVFEDLEAGVEYTITVMVENKSGITKEESKKVNTKSFGELTIDVEDSNEWTSSKNVTITGTTEEYKIEYNIRKYNEETKELEESGFNEYTDSFTLDTTATTEYPILIIARYNDNGVYSDEKTYTVVNIDTTSPTNTMPAVNVSTTKPTSEASVVIRQVDLESGLNESTIEYGYSTNNVDYTWQASSELKKLVAGTAYYVKTRVTNNVGNTVESEVVEYTPGELTTCSVEVPSGWATSKTITILGTQTGAELQYQVGATEENGWNTIDNEGTIKVEENTSVYCRLWDGTTAGATGTGIVEGIDNEDPNIPTSTIRYGSSTGTVRENVDTWSNQTLWWGEFSATDNGESGIDHYEYSSGCTGTKSGDLNTNGYTYGNGTSSTYCIRAVDKAGNESEWSTPYYFKVDTAKPDVPTSIIRYVSSTGTVRENADTWSNQILWWGSFSSSDTGGSTIDHYEYSTGCTGTKSGDLNTNGYTYQNGTNSTYCIRAVDKANNTSSWSGAYYFKVDTTTPTVTLDAVYATCVSSSNFNNCGSSALMTSGTWYTSGAAFRLTQGTVGVSGATIKYCKDTNNTCTPNTTVTSGASITNYSSTTGTYYIRYQITSGAGKSSSIGSYQAKIYPSKIASNQTIPYNNSNLITYNVSGYKTIKITATCTNQGGAIFVYSGSDASGTRIDDGSCGSLATGESCSMTVDVSANTNITLRSSGGGSFTATYSIEAIAVN